MQLKVDKIGDLVTPFRNALVERLRDVYPRHHVDSIVALLSKKGCKAQLAHTDNAPAMLEKVLGEG